MKSRDLVMSVAAAALVAAGAAALTATDAQAKETEKCYGVVKAGKNDCATNTSSCAGTSKTDGQDDAWVAMPKGLCDKLVGGSTSSKS